MYPLPHGDRYMRGILILVTRLFFRFNQASRVLNGIAEGQTVHLTVDRRQGSYRSVRVNWNCGSQSQNDFSPWNGQLVFAEVCRQISPNASSFDRIRKHGRFFRFFVI